MQRVLTGCCEASECPEPTLEALASVHIVPGFITLLTTLPLTTRSKLQIHVRPHPELIRLRHEEE